jgi:hypothetical protein
MMPSGVCINMHTSRVPQTTVAFQFLRLRPGADVNRAVAVFEADYCRGRDAPYFCAGESAFVVRLISLGRWFDPIRPTTQLPIDVSDVRQRAEVSVWPVWVNGDETVGEPTSAA